jgi:peptide/nickel transport system substrate-binding protein
MRNLWNFEVSNPFFNKYPQRLLSGIFLSLILSLAVRAADLRVGVSALPRSADPHFGASRTEQFLHSQIYEGLADTDAEGQPVPRLAENWERTGEGVWLFRLRRNVHFHNGRVFTARDVIFSFCRTSTIAGSPKPFAAMLADAIEVEMATPYSILVRLRNGDMRFPTEIATIPIVAAPAGALNWRYQKGGCTEVQGQNGDWLNETTFASPATGAGTGPFQLATYGQDRIVATRNPNYWGQATLWNQYELVRLTENDRVRATLESRVDVLDNPPLDALGFLTGRASLHVVTFPSTALSYLQFNVHPRDGMPSPFQDARVRRAVSLAIPRDALAKRVLPGLATPAGQMPLRGSAAYDPAIPESAFDPAEARRLLTEAGYPQGFEATMLAGSLQKRVADVAAHFLANIGIRLTVREEAQDVLIRRLNAGEFELYCVGWIFNPSNIAGSYQALLGSDSAGAEKGLNNYGGYANADLDQLLANIRREASSERREQLTRQATQLIHADTAWVPLAHTQSRWAVRQNIVMDGRIDRSLRAAQIRLDLSQAETETNAPEEIRQQ